MHNDADCLPKLKERIDNNRLQQKQLHDVANLTAELRRLSVRYGATLKQEGMRSELLRLEYWLETQGNGPAPAGIISESGISWLTALRDRLKLSADEAQRLEGEGGNPSSEEQIEKTERLLKAIRRIDAIITENSTQKPH